MSAWWKFGFALALLALAPAGVSAQSRSTRTSVVGSSYAVDPQYHPSSEGVTLEFRAGTYEPDLGSALSTFRGDLGPMLGLELDVHIVRIPYVGPLAVGASFGWAEWDGPARSASGGAGNVGSTGLSLVNMNVLAVLRIDALARYLDVPLVFSGKIGPDLGHWQTGSGGRTQATGWSFGLRWAAQVALELDFLDQRAARRLDDEWSINHSFIFFELYGSTMGQWFDDQLPMGTGLTWAAGLGFTF